MHSARFDGRAEYGAAPLGKSVFFLCGYDKLRVIRWTLARQPSQESLNQYVDMPFAGDQLTFHRFLTVSSNFAIK